MCSITIGGISLSKKEDNKTVVVSVTNLDQKEFEKSLPDLLEWLLEFGIKRIIFWAGGSLVIPDWFIQACSQAGILIEITNVSNPFLEGSPYEQEIRILEFAMNYHLIKDNPLPWMATHIHDPFVLLEDAFIDSCVATQACVIKAMALIRAFDDYSAQRIDSFINRAQMDSQAFFISDAIDRLMVLNSIKFK